MAAFPPDKGIGNTLALLNEAHTFIPTRRERLHSDVFETPLMLQKHICAMGKDAAAMFYRLVMGDVSAKSGVVQHEASSAMIAAPAPRDKQVASRT